MGDNLMDEAAKYGISIKEIREAVNNCEYKTQFLHDGEIYCRNSGILSILDLCSDMVRNSKCKVIIDLINERKSIQMTNEEIISTLKNNSCYECSWGCESPVYCRCPKCEYKDAHIIIINKLENESKK